MNKGKVFVISAPSGTGKGTIINRIFELKNGVELSVSATTRKPRAGEVNGVHYHFLTMEKFDEMIEAGEFLEYATYAENKYGTPLPPIKAKTENGIHVILEIEVQGYKQVKEKMPEAVSIFIVPPSMEELERRLRNRGTDDEETIIKRLTIAKSELLVSEEYDYIVVNDEVDRAAREIISIIDKEQESI